MTKLSDFLDWATPATRELLNDISQKVDANSAQENQKWIETLTQESKEIHEVKGINLNPASNILNPRAEKILAGGLSSRASLGHPGDKYEVGLDAIEKIEIIASTLACEVFEASYAEYRVASGALANLYSFMATCNPGDTIIAPPPAIGGHITHHKSGAAGLYGIKTIAAPIDPENYTVDLVELEKLAKEVNPKLITIGGSLNLFPHPVAKVREIADKVGAKVLFDAAHLSGLIAGKAWENPLKQGAHLMSFSTYKSLGGPAGGLVLTYDSEIAKRIDEIAYPGLTANFDPAKTAALAITLQDWKSAGVAYAKEMVESAKALATELDRLEVPVFGKANGFTASHQIAIEAEKYGGGQTAAKHLAKAGLLACGIGLPIDSVAGDLNGLRVGTPEIVRVGMKVKDMAYLASLISRALAPDANSMKLKEELTNWRSQFNKVHYTVDLPN